MINGEAIEKTGFEVDELGNFSLPKNQERFRNPANP